MFSVGFFKKNIWVILGSSLSDILIDKYKSGKKIKKYNGSGFMPDFTW